ncbi:hypothetical protein K2173_001150 [Erythroxylum novogranatense]|uniref:Uncharacterized protein n=1 Tax=Erythroxylum novogranatense TaxID=1862640 RepID=A0AAV8TIG0_9ROSI|nr:hypothetical protein K2173_001150 [Erythroxylum novogranatense]
MYLLGSFQEPNSTFKPTVLVPKTKTRKRCSLFHLVNAFLSLQRLEMCVTLVRLAMECVIILAQAIGILLEQNRSPQILNRSYVAPVPFIGYLP